MVIINVTDFFRDDAVTDTGDLFLVFPVIDEAVVSHAGKMSLNHRRRGSDGNQVRKQRAEAVVDGCQVFIVSIREINLQCLYIQPAMLADSKKSVIFMIIIAFTVVPYRGLVKSECRVHTETKQPVPLLKYMVKSPDPFYQLTFKKIKSICSKTWDGL